MTTQEQKTTRRKELGIFLLFSFGLAWLLQIAASKALLQGDAALFSPLLSLSMLCPLAGALACKLMFQSSLGVGWRPAFKGKLRWWAAAWFGPALLTFLGAALYFLIFPARLDTSGTALLASGPGVGSGEFETGTGDHPYELSADGGSPGSELCSADQYVVCCG